jgi:UDP-N-acetylglucosamine:LPS N-acetylglucosamine transferase
MNVHYKDIHDKNTKYLDDLKLVSKLITKIKKFSFKNVDIKKIEAIENEIKNVFGVTIDLKSILSRNIIRFKTNLRYYSKLLKSVNPKVIFLVVSYSYMELICAAKINNIPTIEIQHGVITKYSIAYNFSKRTEILEYFPDKLILFGDFWKKNIELPLPDSSLISAGFPFLEHQIEKYATVTKNEKQILFVSQGTIGKDLFKIAVSVANELHDFEIIFKLHPGEYANWKEKYDSDDNSSKLLNFKIIDNNKENIYSLFTKSNIVIGVYSTAIYEALAFKCKCILVDLPGVEYMESLIDESAVLIADNHTNLIDVIKQVYDKDIQVDPNYYFRVNTYKDIFKSVING